MNLSIIIVNYKSWEKTLACVQSIKKSNLDNLEYEIIVVDNASGDDGIKKIREKYPSLKIVQNKKNIGMGAGNNLGIKKAKGNFVLVLNPDTIVRPDAIKILCNYLENNSKAGIVGPKLLNPDKSLQYSCFREYKFFVPLWRRTFLGVFAKKGLANFLMKDFDHQKIREVDWLLGSCLLFRKKDLDKIGGGFDERFFMYFEDTDLCRRFRQKKLKVVYNPEAIVVHDHVRASAAQNWCLSIFVNRLTREHIKSWLRYFWKWGI